MGILDDMGVSKLSAKVFFVFFLTTPLSRIRMFVVIANLQYHKCLIL